MRERRGFSFVQPYHAFFVVIFVAVAVLSHEMRSDERDAFARYDVVGLGSMS